MLGLRLPLRGDRLAVFCPNCGHNDAELMFHQSISRIQKTFDSLPELLPAIADRDTAENMRREAFTAPSR